MGGRGRERSALSFSPSQSVFQGRERWKCAHLTSSDILKGREESLGWVARKGEDGEDVDGGKGGGSELAPGEAREEEGKHA